MRLIYNAVTDSLQMRLRSVAPKRWQKIAPDCQVIFDAEGLVVGFELKEARKRLTPEELSTVSYENLGSGKRSSLSLP